MFQSSFRLAPIVVLSVACSFAALAGETISMYTQERVKGADGIFRLEQNFREWEAEKTAIIVCDMWDRHWCEGATRRVGEMAPRMETVLRNARALGVLIIHAPSSTMTFYEDSPQRAKAQHAAHADMPSEDGWRHLDAREGPLPIDDSDGGCDCWPPCAAGNTRAWTRQIATLSIGKDDVISDQGQEVFNILEAEGRDNVIVMGVHTNMCVLGRPFSIRANVMNGKNVVLMRDLTDSMYNSRSAPFVNHFSGTDRVIEHIEKFWAPTITSAVFSEDPPFRFSEDRRPHVVFLLHEDEYDAARSLPEFARVELEEKLHWKCTYLIGRELHTLNGLEVLSQADLLVVYVRRQVYPSEQIGYIKAYCESGKPVVGIRTASHAFAGRRGRSNPAGVEWVEFDRDILGGNYTGHFNNKSDTDPTTVVWPEPEERDHAILRGVDLDERTTRSWLYKTKPLAATATPLMFGKVIGSDDIQPVAWTNRGKYGNPVFYTSMGHPDDFTRENFRRLLSNGMQWAMSGKVAAR